MPITFQSRNEAASVMAPLFWAGKIKGWRPIRCDGRLQVQTYVRHRKNGSIWKDLTEIGLKRLQA